jgi:NAD(P)-dependent dehydrogenase (short-subunit alcohol dehydrogenase family)
VNCIAPGLFAKALHEDPVLSAKYNNETPLRRMGEPDDIGRVFGQPCRAVRDRSDHHGRWRDDGLIKN